MFKCRTLTQRLESAVRTFRVVVLSGARQTGKTTLLREIIPTWDFVTFDPVTDVENVRADPDLYLDNHPPPRSWRPSSGAWTARATAPANTS